MLRGERWWVRELERRERAWEAERASLVATICHLAGKPLPGDRPFPAPDEPELATWTPSPEQLPIN